MPTCICCAIFEKGLPRPGRIWGPRGLGFPSPVATGRRCFAGAFVFRPKVDLSKKNMPKCLKQKVEIEGVGPPWRDPRRNSAQNPGPDVKNDHMATRLLPKRLFGGSLGVPGPARTPLGSPRGSQSLKTLIFLSCFKGWSQKHCFSLGFSRVRPNMGSNLDLPEPKWRGCLERNWGS